MSTITRTDVHRPASPDFDPAAYELRGVWDLFPDYPAPHMAAHRLATVNALVADGYRFGAGSHGRCGHCGTRIRYAALMARPDVREMIYVGETCLDERFSLTKGEFDALRKAAALNRERMAKADRIAAAVDAHPLLAWLTYPAVLWNSFLEDVGARFRRDGRLSDRQIEAVERAIVRDTERRAEREVIAAREAAVRASGVLAPEGRVDVEGEVVSVKDREGYMGGTEWKMVVRTDAGWAAWLTVPSAILNEAMMFLRTPNCGWAAGLIGHRVAFTATLTRSDRDPLFAFAKRPAKARLLD